MNKRITLLFLIILLSVNSIAQKVIHMEDTNGVYRIACSVNGAKMKMIFDTGASAVSLSETMANFLYDNGYISKEDVLGTSKSQTADGAIHNNVVINIKDIEISGLHLKNVRAVVISSQNAPLLLGQTAIQKLGQISLNGDKLIINDYEGDYSDEEIERIGKQADMHYNEGHYYSVIELYLKIIDYDVLTTHGYYQLVVSYSETKQYEDCIKYGKEWEKKYRDEEPTGDAAVIYYIIASSLALSDKEKEAIPYMEKAALINGKLGLPLGDDYTSIAFAYMKDDVTMAITYFKKALKEYFVSYKTSEKEINSKGIDNKEIGKCLFLYAYALYGKNDRTSGDYIMGLSAKCNYDDAIQFCYNNNINYKSRRQVLFE